MKKLLTIFAVAVFFAPVVSMGEIMVHKQPTVTKKSAVKTQKTSNMETAVGLLQPVMQTVQAVMQLKQETQELSANCAPAGGEIEIVNDLVKEWAKIGTTAAKDSGSGLGDKVTDYAKHMENAEKSNAYEVFYDGKCSGCGDDLNKLATSPNTRYIWCCFPMASKAKLVNGKNVSNIYDVLNKIPFVPEDYTKSELSKVTSIIEKSERCAPGKISAKKRELWSGFLTDTITNIGTKAGVSGVGDVMQMAAQFSSGDGGITNVLGNFTTMVPSMLDK